MTDMLDDNEGQVHATTGGVSDMLDDSEGHSTSERHGMSDTSDDTVGQVEAGGWMTVPQAALNYRKSTKTIERWVEAGRLQKHPTARPVQVWVPGLGVVGGMSDVSDDTVGPDERAVVLAERVTDAVGRQVVPILAALERSEERARTLERENGTLVERVAGLERELVAVRQTSDTDRQRLTAELEAALEAARDDVHDAKASPRTNRTTVSGGAWWRPWWPLAALLLALVVAIGLAVLP